MSRTGLRVGLMGGSFDPIHIGHCVLAEEVRHHHALDRVIFLPAAQSPHKPKEPRASSDQRRRMVEAAIAGNPAFQMSTTELERGGVSYTVETVESLLAERPEDRFLFMAGADILPDLADWHRVSELLDMLPFVIADRPGSALEALDAIEDSLGAVLVARLKADRIVIPQLEVSSSDIRERVRTGRSIRHLVPEGVEGIIRDEGLYR